MKSPSQLCRSDWGKVRNVRKYRRARQPSNQGYPFSAIEPALRAACTIWAAWPRTYYRALWRHVTRPFGGSGAAAGSVHSGVIGLQYLFRGDRRVNTARRDVVGRTNW